MIRIGELCVGITSVVQQFVWLYSLIRRLAGCLFYEDDRKALE